ncbi:MAG: PHP domain-containing protein, partial [Patescibacteria group bacterium]
GEIEAATKNMLPKNLIELKDIKGDLHAHSTYSDGGNTIEQMAMEAHRRGYEYIAITDHSPSLHVAHGLDKKRLVQKKKEIDKLNEKLPIRILFGTEVDIMKNGSIDYPDVILQEFDIVVASIHSYFNEDNTDRLLAAMGNPYVHIIGHPSGRLLGQRKPYQLDYEKIFERAAETGTIIEINAQPQRLDLADIYIRSASRAGVKFSIDSDAHSTDGLWLMDLGVSWARRGWVEKQQVVNTLSLDALKRALK